MEKIKVTNISAGKRIDKFLSEEFFSLSRGEVIRQIRRGMVLVNGQSVKPSRELSAGEELEIDFSLINSDLTPNNDLEIGILFEDEQIVVIDKPAGIQMHPSAVEKGNTIANWLLAKYPQIKEVHDGSKESYLRPGIVHRLDKDTSGIVVVAKTMESFLELKKLFSQREVLKKYVALLYGNLEQKSGEIRKPIARASNFKKQKIANSKTKGKIREALTLYNVLERYEGFDLVEAEPKTGRMHQIRIHFSSMGNPVVGDSKYFLKKYADSELECAKRQMLHAKELKFELLGKKYEFFSEIPVDFSTCLKEAEDGLTNSGKSTII